jgi:mannose-1-phosphate guanylyltransferase
MERTADAVAVQTDPGWSDVGTWQALWAVSPRDGDGNVAIGDVHLYDAGGCYVRAEKRHVTAIGVQDLVIVETDGSSAPGAPAAGRGRSHSAHHRV